MSYIEWIINISKVIAALAIIFGLIKAGWIFFKAVISHFKKLNSFFANVEEIRTELKPNSGSSLADSISRIETRICGIEQTQITLLDYDQRPVFRSDPSGRLVYVNKAYCCMLNVSENDLLGNNWKSLIHFDDQERVFEEVQACVKDERTFNCTHRFITSGGSVVCSTCIALPMKDGNGRFLGFVGVIEKHDDLGRCT